MNKKIIEKNIENVSNEDLNKENISNKCNFQIEEISKTFSDLNDEYKKNIELAINNFDDVDIKRKIYIKKEYIKLIKLYTSIFDKENDDFEFVINEAVNSFLIELDEEEGFSTIMRNRLLNPIFYEDEYEKLFLNKEEYFEDKRYNINSELLDKIEFLSLFYVSMNYPSLKRLSVIVNILLKHLKNSQDFKDKIEEILY